MSIWECLALVPELASGHHFCITYVLCHCKLLRSFLGFVSIQLTLCSPHLAFCTSAIVHRAPLQTVHSVCSTSEAVTTRQACVSASSRQSGRKRKQKFHPWKGQRFEHPYAPGAKLFKTCEEWSVGQNIITMVGPIYSSRTGKNDSRGSMTKEETGPKRRFAKLLLKVSPHHETLLPLGKWEGEFHPFIVVILFLKWTELHVLLNVTLQWCCLNIS